MNGLLTIVQQIARGDLDGDIKSLYNALNARQDVIATMRANEMRATLKIGDKIVLRNISPKYLSGYRGSITGFDGKLFTVDLDTPQTHIRKYRTKGLKVHASCLEAL